MSCVKDFCSVHFFKAVYREIFAQLLDIEVLPGELELHNVLDIDWLLALLLKLERHVLSLVTLDRLR